MRTNRWWAALVAVMVLVPAGCGDTSMPAKPAAGLPEALLPSPLLDRCSQLDVEETLKEHGRPEVLDRASVSTLDGMFCSFETPGPDSEMYVSQALADGFRPPPDFDQMLLSGGERIEGFGDQAIVVAEDRRSARIDFDLDGNRWTVEVYGDGDSDGLVDLVKALAGRLVPVARRLGPLKVAEIRSDPASPSIEGPTDGEVADLLGGPAAPYATVTFLRDYGTGVVRQNRDWTSTDLGTSFRVGLRAGAHSSTPREAVDAGYVEYNEGVQNREYLADPPDDQPVDGLGEGALADVNRDETTPGEPYDSFSYTFRRGDDLYEVSAGGRFGRNVEKDVFALAKAFYDAGVTPAG